MGDVGGYAVRDSNNNIIGYSATRGGEILPGTENIPSENFLKIQAQYNQQHGNIVTGGGTYQNSSYIPPSYPSYTGGAAGILMQQLNTGVNPANINKYVAEKAFKELGGDPTASRKALLSVADEGRITVPIREYLTNNQQQQSGALPKSNATSLYNNPFTAPVTLLDPQGVSKQVTQQEPGQQQKTVPDLGLFSKNWSGLLTSAPKTTELNSSLSLTNQSNKDYGQVNQSRLLDNINRDAYRLSSDLGLGLKGLTEPRPYLQPEKQNTTMSDIFSSRDYNPIPNLNLKNNTQNTSDFNSTLYNPNLDYGQSNKDRINADISNLSTDLSSGLTNWWVDANKKDSTYKNNSTGNTSKNNSLSLPEPLGSFGSKREPHQHAQKPKKKVTAHNGNSITESSILKDIGLIPLSKPRSKKSAKKQTLKKTVRVKKTKHQPSFWGI